MSEWIVVFRDAVPGVAGVTVYDKGHVDSLGRYCIAKAMKLANGRFLTKQTNRCQRPAAVRFAKKFLTARAAKAGVVYKPGAGVGTIAFNPVGI